jgi:hypothetical protein
LLRKGRTLAPAGIISSTFPGTAGQRHQGFQFGKVNFVVIVVVGLLVGRYFRPDIPPPLALQKFLYDRNGSGASNLINQSTCQPINHLPRQPINQSTIQYPGQFKNLRDKAIFFKAAYPSSNKHA